MADANRVVLGTRRLEGLLNGDVTIAGPVEDLRLNGEIGHHERHGGKDAVRVAACERSRSRTTI